MSCFTSFNWCHFDLYK